MSPSTEEARQYARIRYRLIGLNLFISWGFLLCLQLSGISACWAGFVRLMAGKDWQIVLGYMMLFGPAQVLVDFPLHFYSSFVLEHRFHLSRLSFGQWLLRYAKRLAVGGVLGLFLVEALYWFLRALPNSWPIWATGAWVIFSIVIARAFPVLLLPIFYKTSRIENGPLVERLMTLCRRTGVPALGVFRFGLGAETRKANAALAGFGSTRRVLLSDTLISNFTEEEIESVLGHELAHHRFRHITKMLVLSALGAYAAFQLTHAISRYWTIPLNLTGIQDIAGFPMLSLWLSVLGFASLPLQNGISRAFEWQCDRFAVTVSSPAAFAAALRKLGDLNLADPDPPRWVELFFYDHPAINKRVRFAEQAAGL